MASIDRDAIGSMLHALAHSSARRILRSSLIGPLVSDPVHTFAFFSRRR